MFETVLENTACINLKEIFSYFSCEIFCALGIILNFLFLIFSNRKSTIVKISKISVLFVFLINILTLAAVQISNFVFFKGFDFTLFSDFLNLSDNTFFLKTLFYLFFFGFFLFQYKNNRKLRSINIFLNIFLLFMVLSSSLLLEVNNFISSFFLFGITLFLAYKYSSFSGLNQDFKSGFQKRYLKTFGISSAIFLALFLIKTFVQSELQAQIINAILIISFFMVIGVLPLFNYTNGLKIKNNFSFCVLNFLFLPFLGCILFQKLYEIANLQTSYFLLLLVGLLSFSMVCFSISAIKQKNLLKSLVYLSLFYFSFCLINQMLFLENPNNQTMLLGILFSLFSIYSLLSILSAFENFENKKINFNLISGLCYKDFKLSNLIILSFLVLVSVFPSALSKAVFENLKNIYLFDKYVAFSMYIFILANALVLFYVLKIAFAMYSAKTSELDCDKEIKRETKINLIISLVVLLVLFVLFFK